MFNNYRSLFIVLVFLFSGSALLYPHIALGQGTTYDLLAPLPEGDNQLNTEGGFIEYAKQFFPFLLSIAAILAVVMIVVGGIQYTASAGSESAVKDAKDRIVNALLGLLLAVTAWLILYTINPDLIKLQINVNAPTGGNGGNTGSGNTNNTAAPDAPALPGQPGAPSQSNTIPEAPSLPSKPGN